MIRIPCLLIALLAVTTSTPAVADKPAPGIQVQQSFETSDGTVIEYLLYLPKDYQAGTASPLMLFLHGRGESYGPLDLVAKWGPPRMAARGDDLPFIVVSPQCPGKDRWSSDDQQKRLSELLDFVVKQFAADKNRLYLTGLSMGGFGSWRMAADQPKRFAAVVPICGKGDPENGEKLVDTPIWVFHGDQDKAVPFEHSVEMVAAIKQAGGEKIRFTTLEGIGHNSWSAAYATPELYGWMLKQSLAQPE